VRRLLEWVAARRVTAHLKRAGRPYLDRHYVWRGDEPRDDDTPAQAEYRRRRGWAVFLHHIVAGDPDPELHDHPSWSVSIILAGGYLERRLVKLVRYKDTWGQSLLFHHHRERWFGPGSINVIRGTDFHRLFLEPSRDAWTLFIRGPRVKPWGFLQRDGSVRIVTERLSKIAA
jgi:hypothetical protein